MNFNGFNLFSPSVQAEEVRITIIDTVNLRIPGTKGKRLSLGVDPGMIEAIGLGLAEAEDTVHGTQWNLVLKFVNTSKHRITVQAIDVILHNKKEIIMKSVSAFVGIYEMTLTSSAVPQTDKRTQGNVLPFIFTGESEKAYLVSFVLRLYQKKRFRKSRFISIPASSIKEPETYHNYFQKCDLVVSTSIGKLKVKFNVPIFVGDTIAIPE